MLASRARSPSSAAACRCASPSTRSCCTVPAATAPTEPRRSGRTLLTHPGDDRARVVEHGPVLELQRRQLGGAGGGPQLLARPFAQEGDGAAVGGDHLLVLDPR